MSHVIVQSDINALPSADKVTGQSVLSRIITGSLSSATDADNSNNCVYSINLDDPDDYLNILGSNVEISNMSNSVNNGTFIIQVVDIQNLTITVKNQQGVAETGSTGSIVIEQKLRGLHVSDLSNLVSEAHDAVVCTYDISGNMLTASFYVGGIITGTLIATLTMTYDLTGNMLTAVRS